MPTFFDHLIELRSKILVSCFAVVVGALVAHWFHEALIAFLLRPVSGEKLLFLSPLDPLFFILKVDVFAGCILALPVINWCAFSFVKPAMRRSSWFLLSTLYGMAAALAASGLAYAYYVMVPISLTFLLSIHVDGTANMITATSYLNFLLVQSLITAIIFQIPLFFVACAAIGAFPMSAIASKRRHIYVIGLIALAVLTPTTDIFNLCVVALPALLIFEGSLVAGRVIESLRRRRAATVVD
jgi:sec-independent protein translocase protein TatC